MVQAQASEVSMKWIEKPGTGVMQIIGVSSHEHETMHLRSRGHQTVGCI